MFSFLGKEQAPVQLYGKLPLAKDYLRIGAGQGAGQAFRDWLDRAFSQAPNAKDALSLSWPAAFVLGDAWGAPLIGAAWPSSDTGGLRPFPFVAFIERKKKLVLEDLESGAPVAGAIWLRMHEVWEAREQHDDAQGFLGAMRNVQVDVASLDAPPPESVAFDTWLEALWPGKGKDGLLELLCGLEALRKQAHRGPIRLPLVVDLPARPQALAWLKLLIEMNLVAREALPTLFFPLGDKPAPPAPEPAPEAPADPFGSSFSSSFESSSFDSSSFDSSSSFDAPSPADGALEGGADSLFGAGDGAASEPLAETSPVAAPALPPAFVTVFRSVPSPMDAQWLRAPQAGRARAAGDLCPAEGRSAAGAGPAPEQLPPLWESLRGAFIALRGRIR